MAESRALVTLKMVADRAGVSEKTASLALNRGEGNEDTVRRVRDAAADLGYELRRARTSRPIFVSAAIQLNPLYYSDILANLRDFLKQLGGDFTFIYEYGDGNVESELHAIKRAVDARVMGAILFSPRSDTRGLAMLLDAGIPVVVVGVNTARVSEDVLSRISLLSMTYDDAYSDLFDDLCGEGNGHKRIAFLKGRNISVSSQVRYDCYRAQMERPGRRVEFDGNLVLPLDRQDGNPSFEDGVRAFRSLMDLDKARRPTAIVAYNDSMALGCIREAREQGLNVPGDVSIVGHDDLPFGDFTCPRLSSIAIRRSKLAEDVAVEFLRRIGASDPHAGDAEPRAGQVIALYRAKGSVGPAKAWTR